MVRRVVVIGGGITGLAAAHALVTAPAAPAVTLLEGGDRLGGKIRTERIGDCLVDVGPDSFLNRTPHARELCERLGLGPRLVPVSDEARRLHVWHGGRAVELPEGLVLGVPTGLRALWRTPVLSLGGKLRAGLDLVLPRRSDPDETVAAFVRRRLGRQVLARILDPLLAGVHAGDPERLALAASWPMLAELEARHRSLILGLRAAARARRDAGPAPPMFLGLAGGMQELVDTLQAALGAADVRLRAPVRAVAPRGGGWRVSLDGDALDIDADAVIVATPAAHAAEVCGHAVPALVEPLRAIPTSATAAVFGAWDEAALPQALVGTGILVPRGSGRTAFACTWTSRKLPGRAPPGTLLLRAFVGGRRDPQLLDLDDAALVAAVREDLRVLVGLAAEPRWTLVARWPAGTPQYEVGHAARLAAIDAACAAHPGLHLAGASYRGVGIPDCIRDGQRAAAAISAGWSWPPSGADRRRRT